MADNIFGGLPKRCSRCGEVKDLLDFNVDRSRIDGHSYICRACQRTGSPEVPNSPERAAARLRGEAWCRNCRKWLSADQVTKQGLCRVHQRQNERIRYASDPEYRERRKAHAYTRKRGVEPVPEIGRDNYLEMFDGQCAYCDSSATTWDHVVPVSKGGMTVPGNILPCCILCNSSKRDRDLDEWLAATGRQLSPMAVELLGHYQVLSNV